MTNIHRKTIYLLILIMALAAYLQSSAHSMTIAKGGIARVAIILDSDTTPAEKTAAKELAEHLKLICGGEFVVSSGDAGSNSLPKVYIGQTQRIREMLPGFDWKGLGQDGVVIKTVGRDLVLAGGRPRGALYAVYTFLEDYLGYRWWTGDASYIPKKKDIIVGKIDYSYTPQFYFREAHYKSIMGANYVFASRLKMNGAYETIPEEYGDRYRIAGWCHTFGELLPPSEYYKDHPEWYSEINGKRITDGGQLCLTNKEMLQEMVKQVLYWIKLDPSPGIISVAQNDYDGACECENCKELVRKTGSQTDALLTFINSVADEVEKTYPDFLVETLAYRYTRKAPLTVKPRHNVLVCLCDIECDFSVPLTHKTNREFMGEFTKWSKSTKNLFIWDYVANFRNLLIPHPNLQVIAPNIRLFVKHNVTGVFEQGDGYNSSAALAPLRTWVIAHLLWNPSLDETKLTNEFLHGYYGKAAPYIKKYLDIMENAVKREHFRLACDSSRPIYFNSSDLVSMMQLFDKAEKAVSNNPDVLKRVKIERMAVDHSWLLMRAGVNDEILRSYKTDGKKVAEDFLALSDSTGNNYLSEIVLMDKEYRERLIRLGSEKLTSRKPVPPKYCVNLKPTDWVDIQNTKFNLAGEPVWSTTSSDATASDGSAARMPGNHSQWGIQIPLSWPSMLGKTVECHVSVKVNAKASKGLAFMAGVYNPQSEKATNTTSINIEDIKGTGYQDYNLGTVTLAPGMYIWLAPPGSTELVESVYVDRGVLVRK